VILIHYSLLFVGVEIKMKISRNAGTHSCPCGSGKKYKNCCMGKDKIEEKVEKNEKDKKEEKDVVIEQQKNLQSVLNFYNKVLLKSKPRIKEYSKIRDLHGEIMNDIMDYYWDGNYKFDIIIDDKKEKTLPIDSFFDTSTQFGIHGLANMIIYKNFNVKCLTEIFLEDKHYKKPEKIDFLNSMLNSQAGLFEVTKVDINEAYAYLTDVLNKKEFCITDIGLSCTPDYEDLYLYTRIIKHNNISFGTGLSIMFRKTDPFIRNWIKINKVKYNSKMEAARFFELHDEYVKDSKGVSTIINQFK